MLFSSRKSLDGWPFLPEEERLGLFLANKLGWVVPWVIRVIRLGWVIRVNLGYRQTIPCLLFRS